MRVIDENIYFVVWFSKREVEMGEKRLLI